MIPTDVYANEIEKFNTTHRVVKPAQANVVHVHGLVVHVVLHVPRSHVIGRPTSLIFRVFVALARHAIVSKRHSVLGDEDVIGLDIAVVVSGLVALPQVEGQLLQDEAPDPLFFTRGKTERRVMFGFTWVDIVHLRWTRKNQFSAYIKL